MSDNLLDKLVQEAVDKELNPPNSLWPTEYINADTKRAYTPHHENERDFVYKDYPRYVLVKGGEGSGKGQPLSTEIPTPDGYVLMGEIQVGDEVLDEGGRVCRVTEVSKIHHKPCYKITFDTEETVVVDQDHLWEVEDYNYRKNYARSGKNTASKLLVLDTKTIYETYLDGYRSRVNYSIQLAKPLELPHKDLPINPYVLGSWLGDGTSRNSQLTVGEEDQDEVVTIYKSLGYVLKKLQSNYAFSIYKGNSTIWSALKKLDLLQNKHIPIAYLRASYEQRLELLQGLMDTDGYISSEGNCEFCSTNLTLAKQVQELCYSLGIKTNCKQGVVTFEGKEYIRYRLHFNPNIPVFKLRRKLDRINNAPTQQDRKQRRFIVKVEVVDSVPTKCIAVDSPKHLYLTTRNLIPTHNSVSGIIKNLERLRRGMNGIMVSPDLPHFKRSLWPEFRRWCPWQCVVEDQRYRQNLMWQPHTTFELIFNNDVGGQSVLICGGIPDPIKWEGPNVSFAHLDEARGMDSPEVVKVLSGRVRIVGPNGEPPQLYITTTPRSHWLFTYFGPLVEGDEDPYEVFKIASKTVTLRTEDNIKNLDADYVENRGATLTESEKRVRLGGEWEDEEDELAFIESISLWDRLHEPPPPLRRKIDGVGRAASDVLVVALDAGVSRDHFALVAVSRHPKNNDHIMVRLAKEWIPPKGKLDFQGTPHNPGPELYLRNLCKEYVVVVVVYDEYQLHDMATRLGKEGVAWMKPFSQTKERLLADQGLYDAILQGKIFHNGDRALRDHIKNADAQIDAESRKRRLVKRTAIQKIDLAVALSMASYECLRLNLK